MKQRVGRIRVSRSLIMDDSAGVRKLMSKIRVLEAINHFFDDTIEYLALCDEFDEVEKGEIVPNYLVICDKKATTDERTGKPIVGVTSIRFEREGALCSSISAASKGFGTWA